MAKKTKSDPEALRNLLGYAAPHLVTDKKTTSNTASEKKTMSEYILNNNTASRTTTSSAPQGVEMSDPEALRNLQLRAAKSRAERNKTKRITQAKAEKDRNTRIKEIDDELRQLNTELHGIGRAGTYGNSATLKSMREERQKRIAELSQEKKTLERTGTFSASELKQFEIEDAKAKKSALPNYNPTARVAPSDVEAYKENLAAHSAIDKEINRLQSEKAEYDNITNPEASGWEIAKNVGASGLSTFNKGLMSTLDFVLPTEVLGKYDFVSKLNDYYSKQDEYYKQKKAESLQGKSTATKALADIGELTVAALPNAVLALMSAGASTATTLGTTASSSKGLVSLLGNVARTAVKNPMYWTSMAQTLGTDYEEAKADGANEFVASATAIIKSALNAGVEIGGGIETLPANLKSGDTKLIKNWVTSLLEEGKEEVVQGVISASVDKLMYDHDKAVWSTSDENAIINPMRMAKEFGMGAAVGGVLGGGQIVTATGVNAILKRANTVKEQNEILDVIIEDDESLDALIEEGKASGEGSESAKLATEIETARANGEEVTRDQVKKLIKANDKAIKAENKTASKPAEQTAPTSLEQAAREVVENRNREANTEKKSISVAEAKKATGYGDAGSVLVAELATNNGVPISQVKASVETAYKAGLTGLAKSQVNFVNDTQRLAFEAGRNDRAVEDRLRQYNARNIVVNKESGFITENYLAKNLPSDVTSAQVQTVDLMAKALGVKAYMTSGLKGNAEINRATGEVPIDVSFEREVDGQKVSIVFHAAHEMAVHRVVDLAPEEGSAFVYELYRYLAGSEHSTNTLADEKRSDYAKQGVEISLAQAMEEVSANNILKLYNNNEVKFHNAIESIVNGTNTKAKQGLRKYIDYLTDIIRKIREALSGKSAQERAEIQAELNEVRNLRDMFETAFAKAVENRKAAESRNAETNTKAESRQNNNKTENDATENEKFSLKSPVEETKDLIAVHNLNEEQLNDAIHRGQFAMPSIAVTNKGHTAFGDISVVFYKDTIDPATNTNNKLYGSDAWTPTQTRLKKNPVFDNDAVANTVSHIKQTIGGGYSQIFDMSNATFKNAITKADGSIYDAFSANLGLQSAYALENGLIEKVPKTNGKIDQALLKEQLDAKLDNDTEWRNYKKWLGQMSDTVITSYDVATNEDIMNNMKRQPDSAKTFKLTETGELTVPAIEYLSLDEYKQNKGRLSKNANAEAKAMGNNFMEWATTISNNSNTSVRNVVNAINSAFNNRYNTNNIVNAFAEKGISITESEATALQSLYKQTVELPTEYFEAKPQRAVGLNEVARVVLPDETSQATKALLDEYGINYVEYETGNEQSRIDALNSAEGVRFSLKQSVEETKDLVAVHNMQVSELERTLDLGGLPMPSIAVIKAQRGHSEYGDVSLVFKKETIDPKTNKANKVYGGDAWTPTYPTIEYKPNEKVANKISDKYYELSRKFGNDESRPLYNYVYDLERKLNSNKGEAGMINELYEDTNMMNLYLLDSGKGKVETVKKETRTELSDAEVEMNEYFISKLGVDVVDEVVVKGYDNPAEHRKAYWDKHGDAIRNTYKNLLTDVYKFTDEETQKVLDDTKTYQYMKFVRDAYKYRHEGRVTIKTEDDYSATQQAIRDAVGDDYRKWVDSLFKGVEEKSGIRNNVDYYTNSGNPRSWEALHWENNLENVVKVMKSQTDVGGGTFFSGYSIWGVSAKNYGSIEEMKADADRLKQLPVEEYNKIKEDFGQRLQEIAHSIMDKNERNPFIAADNAMECIVEAVRNSKTKSGILNNLKQYPQLTVTETTVDDIVSLVSDISNMPTEYFEAKPKRAVELNEIATAIIPDNTSEATKTRLNDMGINYVEYETGNETARLEALNSLEDVKFSLKGTSNLNTKDRKQLIEIIEHLKGEFELTKFAKADPKKLAKMTKEVLKDYTSQADFDETYKAIDELYLYMANGEDGHPAVWDDVYYKAYEVAQEIIQNALVVDDSMYNEYKSLRNWLRNTPMKFTEYDDAPIAYENYNDFRKHNFGRLKFTKDGRGIDSVYQELAELYPEFFNEERDSNTADQLERIMDVFDSLQPTEINPFEGHIGQASTDLANDLISRFFDIPQAKPTFADKAERRVVEAKVKGANKVEKVRQQRDEKIQKLIATQREKTQKQIEKVRQQRDTKIKKEQEKRRDAISKMSETQKAKVYRAQIMRHASDLSKKLVNPTDNQHIPYELQGAVATLLKSINLESNYTYDPESKSYKKNDKGLPTSRTKAFNDLKKVYENIASSAVVDPDLLGENGWLSDVISFGDKRIVDMNSTELHTVWQAIRAIEASVSASNKTFSQGKFETILEYAESLRDENAGKKPKTELTGIAGKFKTLTTLNMLTPETYFHRLGSAGDSIFRMLRDAQDKHISIMKEVSDFTHKTLKDVDVNSLEQTLHTVKLGGEDVQLTTAQIMELYVLMKREQAVEHILVGGILPDVTKGKGLKLNAKSEPIRNLSMEEIAAATSKLTAEQKKIADELQKYVSTVLSEYGNEASMKVYNYEKFLEKNYWTIRTNKQEIVSEIGKETAVTSVANKGMAKGTKPHANTSVRIGSIFDTFASHSSDMATYAAWLGTSEDVNRIRNFVFWEDGARKGTVKGILDTVHGINGSDYLQKLLTDIAIGVQGKDNMNPLDKFIGGYKAASVGANLRVVIQQPTAILRALDMIDAHYIAEGAVRPLKGWEKAKKYAPIAQWKDWGHFDINTGRQMKDVLFDNASLLEKTKQAGMWGASKADSLSWGLLWNAVEAETKANHKELEVGTEAYYETVAKRFTEIIDHTQVVDGILQRSQIMRSPDALTKMATSFMGEPTKQYNMAVAAAYDAINAKGDAKKKAVARLGRTAMSLAVAGIVNAAAQSIIDAMRDDDKEKDYWEKWLDSFGGNAVDTVNVLNYIPFVKDIASLVSGYSVTRMDTAALENVHNAVKNMYNSVTGEGKYTIAESSAQLFAEIARLYGVPVANVKRDIKSLVMSVAIESDSYLMQYRMEKAMLNINYSGNSKNYMDILFNAYNNDREAYEYIYYDLIENGYDADKIKSGMESRMKKAEGVKEPSALSKRYMTPTTEKKYDSSFKEIKSSETWKSATPTQRQEAKADLYKFLTATDEDTVKTREEAKAAGIDETEYTLWQLAKEMANTDGVDGLTKKEKAAAVEYLDLDSESKWDLYLLTEDSEKAIKAHKHGLDADFFITTDAVLYNMRADYIYNGKRVDGKDLTKEQRDNAKLIKGSKEEKVKKYLNSVCTSEKDYMYMLGTVYDKYTDDYSYTKYFGKD